MVLIVSFGVYLCSPPLLIDAIIDMLGNLGMDSEMITFDKLG